MFPTQKISDVSHKLAGRADGRLRLLAVALAWRGWWNRGPTAWATALSSGLARVLRLISLSSSCHRRVKSCKYFNPNQQGIAREVKGKALTVATMRESQLCIRDCLQNRLNLGSDTNFVTTQQLTRKRKYKFTIIIRDSPIFKSQKYGRIWNFLHNNKKIHLNA